MASDIDTRLCRPKPDCSSEEVLAYLDLVEKRVVEVAQVLLKNSDPSWKNVWMGGRQEYRRQLSHLLYDLSRLFPGNEKDQKDRVEPHLHSAQVEMDISKKLEVIEAIVHRVLGSDIYQSVSGLDRKCDIREYQDTLRQIQQAGRRRLHSIIAALSAEGVIGE